MSTQSKKHVCALLKIFQKEEESPCGCQSGNEEPCPQPSVETAPAVAAEQPEAATNTATAAVVTCDDQEENLNRELAEFYDNTVEFMSQLPPKADEQGAGSLPRFDQEAIERKEYVMAKDELRQRETDLDRIADGRAAFASNDQANALVDSYRFSGLESMEQNGLMSARLSVMPWSGDYWAFYLGVLGRRYADSGFPNSGDWNANHSYIQENSAAAIVRSGDAYSIDQLSPSEKYDILVGDRNFSLTKQMWAEGKEYYLRSGQVPMWMGICHGWATAAYMLPRPSRAVRALAADGRTWLTFYPDDIKGLASLLWAKCAPKSRFIGSRCNDRSPIMDPENGRLLSEKCFDTNPGTWHLAVVNQIGASRRSMVMDATYDHEVWNQPVVGYSYRYFNPQSRRYTASLASAAVPREAYAADRFRKYRSGRADSFVGIAMTVSYAVETRAAQSPADSPADDSLKQASYLYDLELDLAGKIIGGEWYRNPHPDFLWTPAKGSRALPSWEAHSPLTEYWQLSHPVPEGWREVAAVTSEGARAPLAAIVERLVQAANA